MSNIEKKPFKFDGYNEYLYTGLQGILMRHNHRIISKNTPHNLNKKILDIGGGAKPHCCLQKLEGVDEYWISDSKEIFTKNESLKSMNVHKHIYNDDPDYKLFQNKNMLFSRIIASHVWEHVNDPENELLKWVSLLEDNGQLDIAIPCDPGWGWRLGQLIGRKKAMQTYNMSSSEIDLMMTREHVNSCQNLIRIIKYYTQSKGTYFPFFIPIVDVNFFIFFRLNKKDFSIN